MLTETVMRNVPLWIVAVAASFIQVATAEENLKTPQAKPVVVVELFTSQGCSSCPPADANLARISQAAESNNLPVYTLSFHVDYWNRLGWTDPYSNSHASQRQRNYAQRADAGRIYTPQMIVNGTTELVGSNHKRANAAIQAALRQRLSSRMTATATVTDQQISTTWQSAEVTMNDVINVALVQKSTENGVPRGENAGRQLKHVNVVRDFKTVVNPSESGASTLQLPTGLKAEDCHVIVYAQSPATGQILAACHSRIE